MRQCDNATNPLEVDGKITGNGVYTCKNMYQYVNAVMSEKPVNRFLQMLLRYSPVALQPACWHRRISPVNIYDNRIPSVKTTVISEISMAVITLSAMVSLISRLKSEEFAAASFTPPRPIGHPAPYRGGEGLRRHARMP